MFPFLALFLFVLGPRLQVVDLHVVATMALAVLGVFVCATHRSTATPLIWFFIASLPVCIWGLLCSIFGGGADFTIAGIFLKWIVYLFSACGVIYLYFRCYPTAEVQVALLRDVFIISAVNAAFVIGFVAVPEIRNFAMRVLDLEGKAHWVELGFRGADLSIGGGATASVYFATIALIALRHASLFRSELIAGGLFLLLVLAAFLTGRTGGLILLALGPLVIGLAVLRPVELRVSRYAALMGPAISLIALILLVGILVHRESSLVDHFVDVVMPWALEGTGLVPSTTGGNQSLIAIIREMFFLPVSDLSVVFGTSNSGRSEWLPYIASDIGYVRVIFGVGLVGLVFVVAAFVPIALVAIECRQRSIMAFAVGISLSVILIVNFKELTLVSRGHGPLLAVFAVAIAWAREPVGRVTGHGFLPSNAFASVQRG